MDSFGSGQAAALWVGLHVFLLLILSAMVVRLRQKHRAPLGDEGIPELTRAIRAFGNATEYVPSGLIGIGVLAMMSAPPLAIHIVGFLLFAGRVSHAFGLSNSGGASVPRAVGIVLTWIAYVFLGAALLFYAVG